MSSPERRCRWLLVAVAVLAGAGAHAAEDLAADRVSGPGLGEAVDVVAVARASLTVYPDGRGLPPGRGDARAGAEVYAVHCQACHGPAGAAPQRTVGSFWPYATTLFDYVRRAMPYPAPGTLSADQVYAVTAYLLAEHGIIDVDTVLDAQTLPEVAMPNRDGFLISPRRP
jgi:cytochrome c